MFLGPLTQAEPLLHYAVFVHTASFFQEELLEHKKTAGLPIKTKNIIY
ncbi:MAG: hypothetical protein FD159_1541 [Syntrophaceae bacterium]|nr:MAG: hypothetical protein FD159_1541 [Syntrophaceae bacterium]